ncbi:MAG: 2-dehydro-3-deoxyphosphogluconate aldolase, partial [Clostridia bacterium]|nr:2-dehydro-3-deoxyphosphogluconate aldolase [Clostridia bacterium]
MRDKIIKAISDEKIITIVRGVPKDKLIPLAEAMYEGGIRLMEITSDATGSIADETTADYIRMLAQHMEGRMYIGAGTVLKEAQVELTKNAGGGF